MNPEAYNNLGIQPYSQEEANYGLIAEQKEIEKNEQDHIVLDDLDDFSKSESLSESIEQKEQIIREKIEEYSKKIWAEFHESGEYRYLESSRWDSMKNSQAINKQKIIEIINEVWEGKRGEGRWVDTGAKITKAIRVGRELNLGRREREKSEGAPLLYIGKYDFLNPENIKKTLDSRSQMLRFDYLHKEGDSKGSTSYWVEVNMENIDQKKAMKELQEIYDYYISRNDDLEAILEKMPADFVPTLECGKLYRFGGCSHHSGEIDGYLMPLPTMRFAVISSYDGEKFDGNTKQMHGAFPGERLGKIESSFSAKQFGWTGEELDELTEEEKEYIKEKVKLDKDDFQETINKMEGVAKIAREEMIKDKII